MSARLGLVFCVLAQFSGCAKSDPYVNQKALAEVVLSAVALYHAEYGELPTFIRDTKVNAPTRKTFCATNHYECLASKSLTQLSCVVLFFPPEAPDTTWVFDGEAWRMNTAEEVTQLRAKCTWKLQCNGEADEP